MTTLDLVYAALALIAALGCGVIAGVFYAFSTFVMKALDRLAPAAGIAAMQSINVAVLNFRFLGIFVGTAVVCVIALIVAIIRWGDPGTAWCVSGVVLYLVGTFFVTIRFNVPRNNILAALSADDAVSADAWRWYVVTWTAWNHVRTAAALAAMVAFVLAMRT